jgi:hypothetical protein
MATVEMRATVKLAEMEGIVMLQAFSGPPQSTYSCRSLTAHVNLGGLMLDQLAWRWVMGLTSSQSTAQPRKHLSSSWCMMPFTAESTYLELVLARPVVWALVQALAQMHRLELEMPPQQGSTTVRGSDAMILRKKGGSRGQTMVQYADFMCKCPNRLRMC